MKKIFAAVLNFIHNIFGGAKNFETFVETHVDDAIAVANKIKALVDNPLITNLIDLLPEKYKTMAKEDQQALLTKVEAAVDKLSLSKTCLSLPSLEEKIQCFVIQLKGRSELDANGTLQKLATAIVQQADTAPVGGIEIKENLADNMIINRITELKNAEAIAAAPDTSDDNADDSDMEA